jgi:hypothetical protein
MEFRFYVSHIIFVSFFICFFVFLSDYLVHPLYIAPSGRESNSGPPNYGGGTQPSDRESNSGPPNYGGGTQRPIHSSRPRRTRLQCREVGNHFDSRKELRNRYYGGSVAMFMSPHTRSLKLVFFMLPEIPGTLTSDNIRLGPRDKFCRPVALSELCSSVPVRGQG